jgi:hypothetical protein
MAILVGNMKINKILVTGGRKFSDKEAIYNALDLYIINPGSTCIIHGGADGADTLAEEYCEEYGIPSMVMFPRWTKFNKAAGTIRNRWMIEFGQPTMALAFPGGTGTANMVSQLRKAGIEPIMIGE